MYSEQDKKEMSIRQAKVDIGMGVGNSLTNATNLAMAILHREKSVMATREDYEKEIKHWFEFLYDVLRDKIDVEHKGWIMDNFPDKDDTSTENIKLPE